MCNNKLLFVCSISLLVLVQCAPRSKSTTTYDQKQSGEYNIQLHLKDFQIIALLGQDSLESLAGDYDYDYDYSDFTIKPVQASSTTQKPEAEETSANATKVNATIPVTPDATTTVQPLVSTGKPMELTELVTIGNPDKSTTENPTPGQIPVIIQDFKIPALSVVRKETERPDSATNVAIVNTEDSVLDSVELPDQPNLGEILHYRKCPQGFGRDKRGRCRKLRRPQIPLGISRLASNLAAKFRQPTADRDDTFSHT